MQFIQEIKTGRRKINPIFTKTTDAIIIATSVATFIYLTLWVMGIDLI